MRLACWFAMLLLAFQAGCAARPLTVSRADPTAASLRDGDVQTIARCAERMAKSVKEMRGLRDSSDRKAGFLQPREHDCLETMLAEYLSRRQELSRISQSASHHSQLRRQSIDHKTQCDIDLASLCVEDPVLWRAMNQSFHRSDIPAGSCDRILHEVTAAREPGLTKDQRQQLQLVVSHQGVLLPAVENELRHAPPAEALVGAGQAISSQIRNCKNMLVVSTGRIKNPVARPLAISDQQRQEIHAALQPGDVLLTYTEGYASNLFIPGSFKHAATFVGTAEQRRQAGLPPEQLLSVVGARPEVLAKVLQQSTTPTGETADVVESVAEGVRLCNLDQILRSRINRLVVLRPQLSHAERAEQIADVLSYVGDEYDFSFDLTDASDQVCTEVVYRSLQGRGGIDLPLSEHAGFMTLTADDILRCCLRDGGQRFACILAVLEARESPGSAKILRVSEAQEWLSQLPGIGQ
ncbi:MAG: YiiX/YebB-like N1pC/P60 family cysteine hydrolase [Pirellulaceae bacterium]